VRHTNAEEMTDHDRLIRLDERFGRFMESYREDTLEIKTVISSIKCPSPRCQDHETRLTTIETTQANKKDSGAIVIAWVGIIIAVVSVIVATYVAVKGG
jgi:hypothetical protein